MQHGKLGVRRRGRGAQHVRRAEVFRLRLMTDRPEPPVRQDVPKGFGHHFLDLLRQPAEQRLNVSGDANFIYPQTDIVIRCPNA